MTGFSGLEDTVNVRLGRRGYRTEGWNRKQYYAFSPEDVNGDNVLDCLGKNTWELASACLACPMSHPLLHLGHVRRYCELFDYGAVEFCYWAAALASSG